MNSGLYAAAAALVARTQSLELAANNLANINTPGYKAQQMTFRSLLASSGVTLSNVNRAINEFGVAAESTVDLSAGNMETTNNPLDFAIEGAGFFEVETKAGTRYTRNGRFQVSAAGELTTMDGHRVLGETGPILIPAGTVSVSPDGTISVNGAIAGRLRAVEFAPGTDMQAEGLSLHTVPNGTAVIAGRGRIRQGLLESSNVNPVSGAVSLIATQRQAEMVQRVLGTFHSEFNRIAATELPRI